MVTRAGVLSFATLAALVAACAPAAAPRPPTAPVAPFLPAAPAGQPAAPEGKPGGILVYAQQSQLFTLNPWKGDVLNARAFSGVYDSLLRYDHREGFDFRREREIKPGLAERWESPDPTTFVFHLRKNVKFHDGQPMTADDVVYSMQAWTDPEKAPEPRRTAGGIIAKVEKMDQYTVKTTIKRPSAEFLGMLAYQRNVYVLPKHQEDHAKAAIGTGPFRVVKADVTSAVILERNPDFYLPGRPFLDGAKVINGMDRASQQAAFIAREMDLVNANDQKQFEALERQVSGSLKSASYLQTHGNSLHMKQDRPPFSDVLVRRAAHLAVDREGLIKAVTFGAGIINPPGGIAIHGFAIPKEEMMTLPGWRQPKEQDIAEAKRLLAEAGYPNGFKVAVITDKDLVGAAPILTAVAPQLKAAGIDVEIQLLERGVWTQKQRDGEYEAWLATGHTDPPGRGLTDLYHSKGQLNRMGISNPQLDALIEQADSELDTKKYGELHQRIQRIILEQHYSVPTVELPAFALWHPWLNNYSLSFSAQPYIPQWDNIWIDVEKAPRRTLQ